MSYKISAKNRKLKRNISSILSFLKFESLNANPFNKVIIFGTILVFISLYLGWFITVNGDISNSFDKILGITGYLIFLINLKILFILFNEKLKDFFKKILSINVKDAFLILVIGLFSLLLTINSIFVISGLSYFMEGIIVGKGIILAVVGNMFIIIGSMIILKSKTNTTLYIDQEEQQKLGLTDKQDFHIVDKNNMKLPF